VTGARELHRSESGITLVEVLVAIFILSVALLALGSTATASLLSLGESRDREQATNAASAAIEAARARDFGALSVDAGEPLSSLPTPVASMLGVSGNCAGTERVVQDAASIDPLPLVHQAGNNNAITVYTLVSWADQPCTATTADMKRVVALATWNDRGTLRSVRNETLVAPAGRGLPVPNFEVKPAESTLSMAPDRALGGDERCLEQQLRNLGASDSYEIELVSVDGGSNSGSLAGSSWTLGGEWTARAFFEHPAVAPRGGDVPTNGLMQDGDGNGRPETDARLAAREQATVTLCYRSLRSDSAEDVTVEYDVVSRFDERRTERLTHHLTIDDPIVQLFLQDRDDTQDHERRTSTSGNAATRYPAYRMNPLNPASGDRAQLLGAELFRWGSELHDVPGLPLLRATSGSQSARLRTVDFRYGVQAPTVLQPGADLRIWTAPVTNLAGSATPRWVEMLVQLDVLDTNDSTVVWPTAGPYTVRLAYEHVGSGYQAKDVQLGFTDTVPLAANQKIRLRVTCDAASDVDCAVGYDAVTHPARLQVELQ
jgi:type II secretory pathway pseudopilin PulG